MIIKSPIITERLIFRSLTSKDVSKKYLNWLKDVEVIRYLEARFSPLQDPVDLKEYIQNTNKNDAELLLGIFLQDSTSRHIGNIKIGPIVAPHKRASIGLMIGDKASWGAGYATESINTITKYAFDVHDLHRINAGIYSENIGSYNAFIKSGYTEEARLKDYWLCDGIWQSQILMYRLKNSNCGK